jgi:alanyl-tRNA synthetase
MKTDKDTDTHEMDKDKDIDTDKYLLLWNCVFHDIINKSHSRISRLC